MVAAVASLKGMGRTTLTLALPRPAADWWTRWLSGGRQVVLASPWRHLGKEWDRDHGGGICKKEGVCTKPETKTFSL